MQALRIARYAALVCAALYLSLTGASAQSTLANTTGLVVSVCGSPPTPFKAGNPGPFTVDTNGLFCNGASSLPTGSATAANQTATQSPVAPATATATKSTLAGCQGTTSQVTFANGQQGTVSCDSNGNLLVSSGGAPNIATNQVNVATTATSVCPARALRRVCTIEMLGNADAFCGTSGVTTGTGFPLVGTKGTAINIPSTAQVFCIVATGTQAVAFLETF